MSTNHVIIVGAGPAGLTAARELAINGHHVTVLESDPEQVGGLARTLSYNGFRFDIGAHRFFSQNPEINRWWHERLPADFLRVKRLSRIFHQGTFFQYPLRPGDALSGLGVRTSGLCLLSYLWRQLAPLQPERSFEDWVRNSFGDRLYAIFFESYTEKVWGRSGNLISADWASQRIKGLSLGRALLDAFGPRPKAIKTVADEFEYPRYGAGMMWERTRQEIEHCGGRVLLGRKVTRLERENNRIRAAHSVSTTGQAERWTADDFIVSMPLRSTVLGLHPPFETKVRAAALQLQYRDFILVALIVNRPALFPDHWIYIHEPSVRVGRMENFKNWSAAMAPSDRTCLGMEYFCARDDVFWRSSDPEILAVAGRELEALGFARASEVLDGCVVRVPRAYPVYTLDYHQHLEVIRQALGGIENLQMIGRNGMHKYNNQDHAMLTGMLAARNLMGKNHDVWRVNSDTAYLEEAPQPETPGPVVPQATCAAR